MEWKSIDDLFEFQKKSKLKASDGRETGKYIMYSSSMVVDKFLDDYQFENEALILGTGGKANVHYSKGKFSTTADCYVLETKTKNILTKYVYKYLKGNIYILEEGFKGAGLKHINQKYIKQIKIPVPPMEIQKKIVEVLDEAQKLIDNRKKQIKLLDDLIESIFYDMFGDPVKNNKGWEVKKFDDFSNVRSSKRVYISECVDKGIPFYRGTEIVKLSLGEEVFPELFITEDHYKALKKETGIPKIGDLLLPSICAKGEVWRVDTNNPFYFKDGRVLWVELESDFIDSKYLQYCLSQVLIKNFEGIASGSTFPEMKIFILKNLEIPIPPLPLQNQFAERVQAIEKQKELLEESLKLMEDNYNSLMQRAFKGELF